MALICRFFKNFLKQPPQCCSFKMDVAGACDTENSTYYEIRPFTPRNLSACHILKHVIAECLHFIKCKNNPFIEKHLLWGNCYSFPKIMTLYVFICRNYLKTWYDLNVVPLCPRGLHALDLCGSTEIWHF